MENQAALSIVPRQSRPLQARTNLVEAFLAGRSPRTLEAYRQDLRDFARFLKVETSEDAARLLLAHGKGPANETAHAYRADMLDRGLAPSTINRRLAALRSLTKMFRLLLDELGGMVGVKGTRDRALVRLLYDLGLRRGEAVGLDLEDVDLQAGTVSVLGKGRTEREYLTLPEPTKAALEAWVAVRGDSPGPLFVNMDRAGPWHGFWPSWERRWAWWFAPTVSGTRP